VGPGDILGDRFEVVERAATGASGVVYRGIDRQRDEEVAIKVLEGAGEPEEIDRFRLEAGVLQSVIHPNIARFLGFGQTPSGKHYLVQQWASGPSLRRVLDRTGLTARQGVSLVRQIASALGEAHATGIVHRDIKPGNILANDSSWVVIDFGVARVLGEPSRLTKTGAVVGTIGYMSPEQASAQPDLDARADVFALGCVLYEILTGRPAFAADSALGVQAMVLLVDPPPVGALAAPALPTALTQLVERCIEKAREVRPSDGRDLARLLAEIEDSGIPNTDPKPSLRDEPATVTSGPKRLMSIVLGGPVVGLERADVEPWRSRVAALFAPLGGGEPAVMVDGSVVYAAPSLSAAADAALVLRRERPDHAVAIATVEQASDLAPALQAAGTAIERSTFLSVFADHGGETSPGVRIDQLTAAHLGAEFMVSNVDDACYLLGRRPRVAK
jgi:hypothetical protein